MSSSSQCPVDHSSSSSSSSTANACPVDHSNSNKKDEAKECPVDHSSAATWSRLFSTSAPAPPEASLSKEREVSSIPKPQDGNWVYPSEAQFFAAMERKNHKPNPADMKTIVPIHNAVNERAWAEIMKWEAGRGGEACGGVQLVNFKGKPQERSPKARLRTLFGYAPPFDRHDWIVDRCGTRMRYIIDFYTGRNPNGLGGNLSFFLDVRPALDSWEGVKMRFQRFWGLK
ncbi:cytochrome C1 heme lyase [Coprinopsis cinerea okayama7|uniref:Holocytochrome c-type synthase n=1 Tax=Coprinopsis cinerea (strain Okayama-7 / 130 / ATCC MYA-4618 / FGSC 9003) TaxID=240176 RepID=A8NFY9_COPC7|nr:cytochrome C1 heme lyase [Coprinopsis cinerea okayama7\|eukprot:XP_001833434.2 cytochrome C1 heme lyase [Coprinopsis cinerea okayama7\